MLTTAKVHHFLIEEGIRLKASIIVATGEVRDSHDLACHIAYGSSAVWPYLALERVRQIVINNKDIDIEPEIAQENYRNALNKGLLKIMSKMGICTISSYRGSELFEIIGLDEELIDEYFKYSKTRTSGHGKKEIFENLGVFGEKEEIPNDIGGFYKHKKNAETHVTSPRTVLKLQKAVRSVSYTHLRAHET